MKRFTVSSRLEFSTDTAHRQRELTGPLGLSGVDLKTGAASQYSFSNELSNEYQC